MDYKSMEVEKNVVENYKEEEMEKEETIISKKKQLGGIKTMPFILGEFPLSLRTYWNLILLGNIIILSFSFIISLYGSGNLELVLFHFIVG